MNTLQYGYPSADAIHWLNKDSFLDPLFGQWDEKPSSHISEDTRKELLIIKEYLEELFKQSDTVQRFRLYDRSLMQHLAGITFEDNEPMAAAYKPVVREVFDDVLPLVYKLKMERQRPRPFQLAPLHNIKISPIAAVSDHSPAYPCLHTCVSMVLAHVCGNRFPQYYKMFNELADDIAASRMYMGLVLPSDTAAGKSLADMIVNDREFMVKYQM